MNYLSNKETEQKNIINDINKDSMKSQCKNIGKISGIYKIINKINGKYYVGSSKDIVTPNIGRWYMHKYELNKKRIQMIISKMLGINMERIVLNL